MTENKAVAVQSKLGAPVVLMPQNLGEVMQTADFLGKSALVPQALRGKPSDIAVILMTGMELGLGPMQALQNIAVVNGKPTCEAKLILALIQSRCPDAGILIESTSDKAVVKMTRGNNSYTATWDIDRARKLGLMEKPNYKSQLGTMLKWRAVTDAARTMFSDVIMGLYSDDEAQDIRETREVDSTVVDKVSRLASKIESDDALVVESTPTVPTPTVAPAPVVQAPALDPTTETLGEYMIMAGPLNGKRLKDVPVKVLIDFADAVEAKKLKSGASPSGLLLEAITRIDQYLDSVKFQGADRLVSEAQDFATFNA